MTSLPISSADAAGLEWFRASTCDDPACPNNRPGEETSTLVDDLPAALRIRPEDPKPA